MFCHLNQYASTAVKLFASICGKLPVSPSVTSSWRIMAEQRKGLWESVFHFAIRLVLNFVLLLSFRWRTWPSFWIPADSEWSVLKTSTAESLQLAMGVSNKNHVHTHCFNHIFKTPCKVVSHLCLPFKLLSSVPFLWTQMTYYLRLWGFCIALWNLPPKNTLALKMSCFCENAC